MKTKYKFAKNTSVDFTTDYIYICIYNYRVKGCHLNLFYAD